MADKYNDQKSYQLMVKARASLILNRGWQGSFYAPLVMRLDFVESSEVPTMATDGKHLFYNPQYACELSEDERIGVIVHEVNHCASLHHHRMGFKPLTQWNEACDYPTNENVLKAGFTLPKGLLINTEYYGMSAEDVYNVLFPPVPPDQEPEESPAEDGADQEPGGNGSESPASEPQEKEAGEDAGGAGEPASGAGNGQDADESESGAGESGEPGEDGSAGGADQLPANAQGGTAGGEPGNGQGNSPASPGTPSSPASEPMGMGGVLPAYRGEADGESEASPEAWEQAVREAVSLSKAKGWGSDMPESIREILSEIETGKHDWKEQFRQFTDNRAAIKPTWKRTNRRFATSSFVMPGSEKDGLDHALWLIDTSGSMDSHWLSCIRGEIQEALDAGFIDRITVVCIDTTVKAVFEYSTGDTIDFEPEGRGGTNFAPAFAWIAASEEQYTCAIYLTDLDCDSFGTEPDCPLLWAVYGRNWNRKVPFGEIIRLTE